jgi:secreted PhoX family phosphatase
MALQRRTLLKAAGAAVVAASPLAFLMRRTANADVGPLVLDPAGLLDLPPGFSYRILERTFDRMSDGARVPARPDGMGCFPGPSGTLILMRNHELERDQSESGFDAPPRVAYDKKAAGGVTRVVVDERTFDRISSNRVLAGTLRNCAGGVSPWGWLTCEETVEQGHGYVFRCPTDASSSAPAERLTGYGRFNHEAACVDPTTLICYLTEDRPDGCLYRYRPQDPAKPFTSGRLQGMRIKGAPGLDTAEDLKPNTKVAVDWVDIPNPDPKDDTVRTQAADLGAARVKRGEGIIFYDGAVFVCATTGGSEGCGQLLKLVPGSGQRPDTLEVFAESPDDSVLDMPDNICGTPWGDILMAEDGPGIQYLRGITPGGRVYEVARNARSKGEFAGVCVAPSGNALFVNLQTDGLTLVIQGPLAKLSKSARHLARRAS